MTARQTFRIGGMALLAGAVLSFLTTLLNTFLFVGNDPTPYASNPLFVPLNILNALGTGLLLVGVPLLYVSRPEGWGALGLVGFALLFTTGLMFGIFFSLFSALFVPYLVQHAPSAVRGNGPPALFPFFIVGTVFEVVAVVLLAVPVLRGLVAGRGVAYVLLAAAVMAVVGFVVGGGNGPSNPVLALVGNLSSLLLFVALGWLGYLLWTGHAGLRERLLPR